LANENDPRKTNKEIYEILMPAKTTPKDICKRYYERGLYGALYDAPRPGQPPKLNGKIALVSGVSNDGQIRADLIRTQKFSEKAKAPPTLIRNIES
jgi:hypothetical protein